MGIFDKFGNMLGGGSTEYGEKDIERSDEADSDSNDEKDEQPEPEMIKSKVLDFNSALSGKEKTSSDSPKFGKAKIITVKPKDFEEVREIADCLRDNVTVILNLEETEEKCAGRILYFICGTLHALHGEIRKVSREVFICAPEGVKVTSPEDDKKNVVGIID